MWPEQDSARAVKRLQMAVTRLRKTLARADQDERRLQTVSSGYLLAISPAELDADRFRGCSRTRDTRLHASLLDPARRVADEDTWLRGRAAGSRLTIDSAIKLGIETADRHAVA